MMRPRVAFAIPRTGPAPMPRSSYIPPCVALLASALAAAALHATPSDPRVLVLRGRVTDSQGWPVERARVVVRGTRAPAVLTGVDGRYSLAVPLGAPLDLARRPLAIRVEAQRGGWEIALAGGQPGLGLDVRLVGAVEGGALCRVRANDAGVAEQVARALAAEGAASGFAEVTFVGIKGGGRRSQGLVLGATREVPLAGVPAPAAPVVSPPEPPRRAATDAAGRAAARPAPPPPAANPPAAPAPAASDASAPPAPDKPSLGSPGRPLYESPTRASDRAADAGPRVGAATDGSRDTLPAVTLPGPGVSQTNSALIQRVEPDPPSGQRRAPPAPAPEPGSAADSCSCRIKGTIELHPDRVLSDPLRVVVSLREAPSQRDTVELFMGSPRGFELPRVGCGRWRLVVEAISRRHYGIVSQDGGAPIECSRGALRQLRLVLAPE